MVYCSTLCIPSAKRSILGSNESERLERWLSKAVGVMNENAEDGGFGSAGRVCNRSVANMDACEGSRSDSSISETVGSDADDDEAGSIVFLAEAMASHAAFSSSSLSRR